MTSMECLIHYRIFMFLGMCVTFITVDGYNGNKIFANQTKQIGKHNNKTKQKASVLLFFNRMSLCTICDTLSSSVDRL